MILRLGHVELYVTDLNAARNFYVHVLGFIEHHADNDHLYLRGIEDFDVWTLKLTLGDGPRLGHMAFRVDALDSLDTLEHLHTELGTPTRRVAENTEFAQGEALRVSTPDGFPVEFYHTFEQINVYDEDGNVRLPMRSTHQRVGIPPIRVNHVNLRVPDVQQSIRYWRDQLHFAISEYLVDEHDETIGMWMHRGPGTHDVAIIRSGTWTDRPPSVTEFTHIAYYLSDPAAVFRAADLVSDAGYRSAMDFGPGRHGVTNAFFMYVRDPAGNRIELFTGDYLRDLDQPPIKWKWEDYNRQGLLWWNMDVPARFREPMAVNSFWP